MEGKTGTGLRLYGCQQKNKKWPVIFLYCGTEATAHSSLPAKNYYRSLSSVRANAVFFWPFSEDITREGFQIDRSRTSHIWYMGSFNANFPCCTSKEAFWRSCCLFRAPGWVGILLCFAGSALHCKGKGGSQESQHPTFFTSHIIQTSQMYFWKRQGDRDHHLLEAATKP